MKFAITLTAFVTIAAGGCAHAQRMPYGAPLTLDQARRIAAAAEQEAKKITQPLGVTIAVHDSGCNLLLLQRMDNTNIGTVQVAQDKAYTACAFRTNTKPAQDRLTSGNGGLILLALHGFTAVEGGMPIVVDGKQVGSVGISGGSSEQDNQIATAAAQNGLKP